MRGGTVHEHILNALKAALEKCGMSVSTNVVTRPGRDTGYGDLLAEGHGIKLLVEIETTSRRVASDLQKAADLEAWLWLVTPNVRVSRAIRGRLKRLGVRENPPWVFVLTYGQAQTQVANCFPLFSLSMVQGKETKNGNHTTINSEEERRC
jgi:hypothetical protein